MTNKKVCDIIYVIKNKRTHKNEPIINAKLIDIKYEVNFMRTDILEKKDFILQCIKEDLPKSYICQQLQCKPETLNSYLKKLDIEYAGQMYKKQCGPQNNSYIKAQNYFGNTKFIRSSVLKQKLIFEGIKENKCEICGVSVWQGKNLPLELHHIDGNHFNNTLDNLQILCPNCHSIMGEHTANRYYKNNKNATMMELEDNCLLEGQAQSVRVQIPVVAPKKICKCCGAPIKKNNKTNLCKNCYNIYERYVDRPNRDILKQEIRTYPFITLSKKYGVSDKAIVKWCVYYKLPSKKSDINKLSDKEWEEI